MPVLRLVGLAVGGESEYDGQYVKDYDPTYVHEDGYDGGILEVTTDRDEAMQFPNARAAIECWNQSYGTRWDGQPNKPLTAWTVEVC